MAMTIRCCDNIVAVEENEMEEQNKCRERGVLFASLSSHHIGIGTKLCCKFEFSVAHYFQSSQQHWDAQQT
jgi:hypothetical protein